uniref:Innexin n=1 Tax=Panagrolaimus davidi TaxID=227884 RepID=A0A914QMQ2_9BILA
MYFVTPDLLEIPIGPTRKSVNTNYYPWIPVVFVSQAILCMVPHYFWESLNYKTGIFIRQLSAALALTDEKARKVMKEKGSTIRSKIGAAKILLETLKYNSNRTDRIFGLLLPRSYLSILYIFYKVLNLVNITGQLLFLNRFLNTRYTFWGAEILWDLIHKIGWKSSGHFPRVIYCDFPRREDSTGHFFESTAQCLIAFNLFNEVLFIGIWFLFSALIIINLISIIKLFLFVFRKESRIEFIEDLLYPLNSFTIIQHCF